MEVTNSNFDSLLPEIENAINHSLFISIDCELSGLTVVRNINTFDSPKEYYEKMRNNCKDFLVMQYGISIFRYDESEHNFKQRTYNFFIFRRPVNKNVPDQRFLCQSSSIDFLIGNGFDFNKLFKEGISYLTEEEAERYKANVDQAYQKALELIESKQSDEGHDSIQISDNSVQFVEDIKSKIDNFLESGDKELQLPKCNAYFRKLIYQTQRELYSDRISLETRQIENDRILFVTKLKTAEEEAELAKKKYDERLREIENFRGFTKVMKFIIKSGKLVVGHNACLDFFHTIDKFLIELPVFYEDFKEISHSLFSRVLDTKYMSSREPFRDLIQSTVLKQLFDTLSEKPFGLPEVVVEEPGRGYDVNDNKEHEAGYDAYITGLCFLGMWKHLGLLNNRSDQKTFHSMDLLEPFMNKLFLMTLTDNQYINLAGEDMAVSKDHVFYLKFPEDWKLNNIQQLFSPFGNIFVSWLDDTSAYIGLYKKDQAKICYKTLKGGTGYTIQTFENRKKQLSDSKLPPITSLPITSKKRKSSESPAPKNKKRDHPGINKALKKMTIEPESMVVENSTNKTFKEDDNWT
ncbi:poly(A)-specific ribonuclease PARN-like [Diorhabda sublineata]|uniref:poly(A)-specific ribonuclease PARN-like n=1 Tax=Diorhabda sublineata TaxID=1163346 RepID=UPI0024E17B6D|nr:poly(A)-specific ribonuclease PARN-like [Diorhabda sublineata]